MMIPDPQHLTISRLRPLVSCYQLWQYTCLVYFAMPRTLQLRTRLGMIIRGPGTSRYRLATNYCSMDLQNV